MEGSQTTGERQARKKPLRGEKEARYLLEDEEEEEDTGEEDEPQCERRGKMGADLKGSAEGR